MCCGRSVRSYCLLLLLLHGEIICKLTMHCIYVCCVCVVLCSLVKVKYYFNKIIATKWTNKLLNIHYRPKHSHRTWVSTPSPSQFNNNYHIRLQTIRTTFVQTEKSEKNALNGCATHDTDYCQMRREFASILEWTNLYCIVNCTFSMAFHHIYSISYFLCKSCELSKCLWQLLCDCMRKE